MDVFDFLNMIGGLALFLYGMHSMGEGLSKMAGSKLEGLLEKLTSKRIFAVLLGAGVTAVIQSSSATTVMVVGFVNSGIMKLSQSVGIIMGANIGTTVTSWLLSLTAIEGSSLFIRLLKPSSFSPVLAIIGAFLLMSGKENTKKKDIGTILLGFAVLMFGMETMSDSVSGLADNEGFTGMMTAFHNPVIAIIIGAVLTAVIQSSSASVGILQALCATGAVPYSVALPIIMGQNIGTCVTSLISSVGASKNAKRAAMIHLYFNIIGTFIFTLGFYAINVFVHFAFLNTPANAAGIAVIHSLFNIISTLILFPFSNQLVKLAEITVQDKKELPHQKNVLPRVMIDERFLEQPGFAVEICKQKLYEMANKACESIVLAVDNLLAFEEKNIPKIQNIEKSVDEYEDVLGNYLVKLSAKDLSKKDSVATTQMLHSISDFERISDHALNLAQSSEEMKKKGYEFSKTAKKEMEVLCSAVKDIVQDTVAVYEKENTVGAKHIEPLEEVIDRLTKKIKRNHIKRLQKGECSVEMGLVLEDMLLNLERVSDHCSNIALGILTKGDDTIENHEYFDEMSEQDRLSFEAEYKSLEKKYSLKKKTSKKKK